jgi:peptidyl-prolyl cis-trans isomerase B (cyclophilin B)
MSTATMHTNHGPIELELFDGDAPKTVENFRKLSADGFYDGLSFHRISGDPATGPFVIQGGDPLGSGAGGPGYSVVEAPPRDTRYTRGTVAMAKTQSEAPGTSGSQFFIVTAPDAGLPPEYALVGRVSGGEDAVQRIASAPTRQDEQPAAPIVIERARLRGGS